MSSLSLSSFVLILQYPTSDKILHNWSKKWEDVISYQLHCFRRYLVLDVKSLVWLGEMTNVSVVNLT